MDISIPSKIEVQNIKNVYVGDTLPLTSSLSWPWVQHHPAASETRNYSYWHPPLWGATLATITKKSIIILIFYDEGDNVYLYLDLAGCRQLRGQWQQEQTAQPVQCEAYLPGIYKINGTCMHMWTYQNIEMEIFQQYTNLGITYFDKIVDMMVHIEQAN